MPLESLMDCACSNTNCRFEPGACLRIWTRWFCLWNLFIGLNQTVLLPKLVWQFKKTKWLCFCFGTCCTVCTSWFSHWNLFDGLNQMVLAGAITCLTGGVLCRQCSTFTPPGRGRGGSSANVNTTTCCAPLQQSDCISDGADCSGAGGSSCPSPCTGTFTRHRAWEHASLSDWGQPLSSAQWHQSYTQWVEHLFMWRTTQGRDLFAIVDFICNYRRECQMSGTDYRLTLYHIPEDWSPQPHCCER